LRILWSVNVYNKNKSSSVIVVTQCRSRSGPKEKGAIARAMNFILNAELRSARTGEGARPHMSKS
jgi:hypothetical protein